MNNYVLTEYQIGAEQTLTIVLLADIHEQGTEEIVKLVRSVAPDLICIAGDTFERYEKKADTKLLEPQCKTSQGGFYQVMRSLLMLIDHVFGLFIEKNKVSKKKRTEQTYEFLRKLQEIAPVYMSLGNHERYLTMGDREALAGAGIMVLDNDAVDIGDVWIGGLSSAPDWDWLEQYSRADGYKILLSHHPERFPHICNIDLVLSGHAHGGQIRVGGRGVYAPDQGLLPKYTKGIYNGEDKRMIVSTGCSNTASVPRWRNPCEVVVIRMGHI